MSYVRTAKESLCQIYANQIKFRVVITAKSAYWIKG